MGTLTLSRRKKPRVSPQRPKGIFRRPLPNALRPTLIPPAWRTVSPVLCLAGRGPLDEVASSILAQLLGKHASDARVAAYELASCDGITKLDVEGVAMVCISYLEISGRPAALHYLVRRLRERIPGVPILVGLWPSEDTVLKNDRVRAVMRADYFTTSLREALEILRRSRPPEGRRAVA